jgi:hypothetical protein
MLTGRPYVLAGVDGSVEVRHRRRYGGIPGAPGPIGNLQEGERLRCRLRAQRVVLLDVAHAVVFLIHPPATNHSLVIRSTQVSLQHNKLFLKDLST